MTWKLEDLSGVLAEGPEAEVKQEAQNRLLLAASESAEAALREALFVTKPDGSHQGQAVGNGWFVRFESINWIDVEW